MTRLKALCQVLDPSMCWWAEYCSYISCLSSVKLPLERQNHVRCDLIQSTCWSNSIYSAVLCELSNLILSDLSVSFPLCLSQDLIVDQTIEKVSFCAPDRNYDKAFSYICRDGTTRRWMCHCFMALKDSVRSPFLLLRLSTLYWLFQKCRSQMGFSVT